MRVLLTGASGFLGRSMAAALAARHEVTGTYLTEAAPIPKVALRSLDVSDREAVRRCVAESAPELVIHAGAMANPERCESAPDAARRVNVDGTEYVARAAVEAGARLFYVSTDLVFDGKNAPYREGDAPNPLNLYAKTKLEAEGRAAAACPDTVVLRLSLCYGWKSYGTPTFLDWLYGTLSRGETAKLFSDQFRSMIYLGDACELLLRLAESPRKEPFDRGLFHMAGPERVSRLHFGELLCRAFRFDPSLLEPVRMEDSPSAAARPYDCSLDGSRLSSLLGFKPRAADEGLALMRAQLAPAR